MFLLWEGSETVLMWIGNIHMRNLLMRFIRWRTFENYCLPLLRGEAEAVPWLISQFTETKVSLNLQHGQVQCMLLV